MKKIEILSFINIFNYIFTKKIPYDTILTRQPQVFKKRHFLTKGVSKNEKIQC